VAQETAASKKGVAVVVAPWKRMQRCGARNGFLEGRGVAAEIVVFNGRGNLRPGGLFLDHSTKQVFAGA